MIANPINKIQTSPVILAENLWLLGNYYFNYYLVRGTHASAIIEGGVSAVADRVIEQLELLNITPSYLIITHPHADHITGLCALMKRYPDAVVVAGEGAKEFIAHPKAQETMLKEDRFISKRLSFLGFKPGRPPIDSLKIPDSHIAVTDEYKIDLGGITLRFINVEGHSPGNIAVHIPKVRALTVSDSLGFRYPGTELLPLFLTDFAAYIDTINYMETLSPEIVCFGHQGPLTGISVKSIFAESRRAAFGMLTKILNGKGNGEELVEELFQEYYREEFTLYSEENIRSVGQLLVRRGKEYASKQSQSSNPVD